MDRLLSRGLANFVGPGVDDRISVEIAEVGKDTASEFGLGSDPKVTQQRARHFGKEALHEIEPGAVFWGEHEGETPLRLRGNPGLGFFGNMGRVNVEDQLDGGLRRIGDVELLEKTDKLTRSMAILDASVDVTAQ